MEKHVVKGRNALIFLFGMIILISVLNIIIDNIMTGANTSISEMLSYFFIPGLLMFLIYRGKSWAKTTFSALLVFGSILSAIAVFFVYDQLFAVLQVISIMIVFGYGTYYLNTKVEIEDFMRFQRGNVNKRVPGKT